MLSDNSPLIIVKNEKQDRHRDINERQLRGEFGNLEKTLATNFSTNRGLDEVVREVKYRIAHLPHVGSELPKTWVRVREALERDPRDYIGRDEYFQICQRHGFTQEKDKLQLSGYLHDLGVCLHFQDDPLLKKIVILKPKWGTDAVYKVLDNKKVIRNHGRFGRDELAAIWFEPEYQDMRDELLQLMVNFRLCYQIPGTDRYIAPQRLPENQPEYEWDPADNLVMRFTYEFMPKGILTQFIVAMHPLIRGQKLVWKSGVVLSKGDTQAEVIEHYGRREVRVRVAGQHKRDLMTIVAYELEKIHGSYKRLKYDQLIPCNCEGCKAQPEPHFFRVHVLRQFLADKQLEIQCQRSYRMVNVLGLIDDTFGRTEFLQAAERRAGFTFEGPIENVIIQQARQGNNQMSTDKEPPRPPSAWVNGSFYTFLFAVVITGVAVLSKTAPWYAFPIAVVAALIFVPLIGILEIYRTGQLSEKSFLDALKLIIGQLPLIGSLARSHDSAAKPRTKTKDSSGGQDRPGRPRDRAPR
jgi:internalin A